MVPSGLHQLVNAREAMEIDFSSVTMASSGAAYLPPNLADKLNKLIPALVKLTEGVCNTTVFFYFSSCSSPPIRIWSL